MPTSSRSRPSSTGAAATAPSGTRPPKRSASPGGGDHDDHEAIAPEGFRSWFPEPRGVGRSGGGPHTIAQAVADLESIRAALGIAGWTVVGDSWGSDLAVRYALDHPGVVRRVVGVAGHGL